MDAYHCVHLIDSLQPTMPVTPRSRRSESEYRVRILGALAAVLVLAVGMVHLWPAGLSVHDAIPFSDRPQEAIQIEDVVPTAQARQAPPPPAPLPPVVVPNDVLVDEPLVFDDGPLPIDVPGEDERLRPGETGDAVASRLPDVDARLVRAVQPDYPPGARAENVRARVVVAVQVDDQGRVAEASIVERWRLTDGRSESVLSLRHGLEDAALSAARRSLFRPAESNGRPVASQTTLTFTFGVE